LPRHAAVALALAAAACAGSEGLPSIEQVLGLSSSGNGDLVAGLKEALEVGTTQAVARTSAVDGFLGNDRIRIPLPDSLQTMASGLRAVGFGGQVDEFEVAMNRAAEQAAGEATDLRRRTGDLRRGRHRGHRVLRAHHPGHPSDPLRADRRWEDERGGGRA
jgi:hypothetical protein